MSELKKTIAFVVVALLLSATAVLATRPQFRPAKDFGQEGQPFFPELKDPREVKALEVIGFDESTAEALPFKVMLKDGHWVIPSHHDYPADAQDRLARTAAGVMDLKKDRIASDRADHWEDLGVIDPMDAKATSLKGRGTRVTLRDAKGRSVADFIIGKEVPGQDGQRFVRVPDEKLTYAVKVNVDLSTRFADWIETNLLKINAPDLRRVSIDNSTFDPERGRIQTGDVLTIERTDANAPWTLEGGLPPDQEINTTKTADLTAALSDLKIVGVRPKPDDLIAALKALANGQQATLNAQSQLSLASRGFYLTRQGLLSNQGEIIPSTVDGVVYNLRFGEITFATGEALSAGSEEEASEAGGDGKAESKAENAASAEGRFLFVTAEFDPELIPRPTPPPTEGELPSDVFQRTKTEREEHDKAEQETAEREQEDYERKLADGKKTATELSERFADWYYVVPADAYRKLMLDRPELTRPKGSAPSASGPPGGLPPGFNLPGIPTGDDDPPALQLPPGHP